MRRKFCFLLFSIVILFFSCENKEIGDSVLSNEQSEFGVTPKSIVNPSLGTFSISNPTLYDDWENIEYIYLNGGGYIAAPWIYQMGNTMNIPDYIRTDIKREDGWVMLGHTISDQEIREPNYILFYQKKSGILKGFYYSPAFEPNANLKWVIKSTQSSSIIPSTEKIYHLSQQSMQYAITSNIVKDDIVTATGALFNGWNCFTFELPYGTINNENPILDISGYNVHNYELTAKGSLSGEVIVPSTSISNSLDSWKNHFSTISSITGAANTFGNMIKKPETKSVNTVTETPISTKSIIGTIGIVSSAVSAVSSIFGSASAYTSKTENITKRYNFSGDIKLTGEVVRNLAGLVASTDNIEINKLNNNESLGVWGLKELPQIIINKYGPLLPITDFPEPIEPIGGIKTYRRNIYIKPEITVEINPVLLPLIKSYNVKANYYSTKDINNRLRGLNYIKTNDDWYHAAIPFGDVIITDSFDESTYEIYPHQKMRIFYGSYMNSFPETYADVLVEIEYNDGSVFSSSRVFKVNGKIYDNRNDIIRSSGTNIALYFR